jgi:hypothetical protein
MTLFEIVAIVAVVLAVASLAATPRVTPPDLSDFAIFTGTYRTGDGRLWGRLYPVHIDPMTDEWHLR